MATVFRKVLDNAETTLDGAIDDSQLSIDVIDGSEFPLTVDCPCILTIEPNTANMEKVLIAVNAANVLTVDAAGRGYEGSVAKSHASGVKIELLCVATNVTELQEAVNALESGVVNKADFNAQSILAATTDDTPAALTVTEQTLVGRITAGNIAALTPAQVMAMLSGQAAADFSMNTHKITGVVDPTANQEAATKKYVDDLINYHPPSITIENPAADDAIKWFFTFEAITIVEMQAGRYGGTSVEFNISHAASLTDALEGSGVDVLAADKTVTSATTGHNYTHTDFSDANEHIPADRWVVVRAMAVVGAVTQFHASMIYTKD